jgi:hypothetical protein
MEQNERRPSAAPPDAQATAERQKESERLLFIGAKRALVGGILAGGVTIGGQLLVGQIYGGTEARRLLEAVVPSARAVGTGVVGASATVLALMLTMISLSRHATSRLEATFFKRIERIGFLSTTAMAVGILLLLLLNIPLQESQELPASWYTIVYYALIAITASVSGLLIAIVLMLYNAMQSLVRVLRSTAPTDPGGSGRSD